LLSLDVIIKGNDYQSSKHLAGGTCGNVLIILSYLGWDAYPVTRLNGDTASRRVLRDLKQWGVRLDFAKSEPRAATPIIIHKIVHNGAGEAVHRFSLKCPHCGSWLPTYRAVTASTAQRVVNRIENPKVFFMDRVSRGSLTLAKASAEKGALIVFEPAGIDDPRLFREALDLTHVLKYSSERMHGLRDLKLPAKPLLEIETLGHKGLRYHCRVGSCKTNGWRRLDSYKITQVEDTAGAGDWCTAGVIHRLGQEGLVKFQKTTPTELQDALHFGQALAAWNCGFEGARGGMYEVDQKEFLLEISGIMSRDEPKASIPANNSKVLQNDPAKESQRTDRPTAKTNGMRLSTPGQAQVACCF
jgi:fructokinase